MTTRGRSLQRYSVHRVERSRGGVLTYWPSFCPTTAGELNDKGEPKSEDSSTSSLPVTFG